MPLPSWLRLGNRDGIGAEELAVGLRILADLLDAGLPMGRVLAAFDELAPGAWRVATPVMRAAVSEGRGLSAGLRESPIDVPPLVIGILRSGESGSGLALATKRASEWAEVRANTRHAIRSALAYPAIVLATGLGAITVMTTVVLPRFAVLLAGMEHELPMTTRIVLDSGTFAGRYGLPCLSLAALAALALQKWTTTEYGRQRLHALLLDLPLVGTLRHAQASARFGAALGALLEGGVPMRQALSHALDSIDDQEVSCRVRAAKERVVAGDSLGAALRSNRALTPLSLRLVSAGEESGRLTEMLRYAARLENQRVDRRVKSGIRLIEPALVLAIAALVTFVAAALLQAVYAVRPQ